MPHVAVKDLPKVIVQALQGVGYFRPDIKLEAATEVHANTPSFEGDRAFTIAINLGTGEKTTLLGSFGGPNPYDTRNKLDAAAMAGAKTEIPMNWAVIQGETGGRGAFARLYVRPETLRPMLPEAPKVSERELHALYCLRSIKPGPYRREEMRRRKVTEADMLKLVAKGWAKQNKAGSIQITTEGKNAIGEWRKEPPYNDPSWQPAD